MIVTVRFNENLKESYSDEGYFISPEDNPSALYIEAIDPITEDRRYIETDILIEQDDEGGEGDEVDYSLD